MDVASILRGIAPAPLGARDKGDQAEPAGPAISAGGQGSLGALANSAAFREILSRHDVTNISPREFSELALELKDAGVVSEQDYQELALIRLELDQQGIDAETPVDLVDIFQEKLRQHEEQLRKLEEKSGGQSLSREQALRTTLRQIDWIQKFNLVHNAEDYQPLDALA